MEENCFKKCQLTVIAAWRLPCELHDADRSAMTHLAFKRDIAAHLLSLRSSRGHFLQSRTQGRCTVRKDTHYKFKD
ncbi:hypothetical protein T12_6195 [Trichinella patagoniensis]|uniref:Uncharacterized protein n=1 Tax=Trichinella patagoniensis TaxID=990121 RepID=A0A0V0ZFK8_9BILA|nr:hypothetical protein T12_6195 [Trichinella patagoniensis]